jgi:hypothetical protein
VPGAPLPAAPPEDFSDVFGKAGEGAPTDDAPDEGDDAETEDALDSAIDEAFSSEDPVARREAFKTACRLCNQSGY